MYFFADDQDLCDVIVSLFTVQIRFEVLYFFTISLILEQLVRSFVTSSSTAKQN